MRGTDDIVTASEIASWAWCPESWRLSKLGHKPTNEADIRRGEKHHAEKANFEQSSRSAISLGWWLVVIGVIVGLVALVLVGKS